MFNMRFFAILALTSLVAVTNANVASVGSHLKLSTTTLSKIAERVDKNAVVITAAKKVVAPLPIKPAYQDTLKMVGLFALW